MKRYFEEEEKKNTTKLISRCIYKKIINFLYTVPSEIKNVLFFLNREKKPISNYN